MSTHDTNVQVHAAGAVLWRERRRKIEILLVHRPRYRDWSIPKGKLDPGESTTAAAVREVEEETGLMPTLGVPLPSVQYYLPDGRLKQVDYWVATVRTKTRHGAKNKREVDAMTWVTPKVAVRMVAREEDKRIITEFQKIAKRGDLQTHAVIVQRHAAAVSRKDWARGESSRPLTPKGAAQAAALPDMLDAFHPVKVCTSPWKRCRTTIAPFTRGRRLSLSVQEALTEARHAVKPKRARDLVRRALRDTRTQVVCTHRPVLPTLFAEIAKACAPGVASEIPGGKTPLAPAEMLVAHVNRSGVVVAVEVHRPEVK